MLNEREILSRLKNADHLALKEIYELYIHKLHRFVSTYIQDKEQVKDIVQLTFIKIWEKKETIDLSKSFKAFVFTIAYRNVIDHVRRKETITIDSKSDKLYYDESFIASDSAEDILNRHELDSVYTKSLETLSPKKREIFILSRHEGMSNREIADKLGISVKTVEYHMTDILASLKEYFIKTEISVVVFYFLFFFY